MGSLLPIPKAKYKYEFLKKKVPSCYKLKFIDVSKGILK